MIHSKEINLHQNSIDYAKETFSHYAETDQLRLIYNNPIIHMYAKEDAFDKDRSLNGYIDALFFELHLYDTENGTVWKSNKYYDGIIPFGDLNISQIKIFKDMSTLIALRGNYRINGKFQAFEIEKE